MIIHVTPVDDLREHNNEDTNCHCEPKIELVEGGILVIHNSYDQREVIEQVNEILGNE